MTDDSGESGLKADLTHYLQQVRGEVVRGLDGLSEYDGRRPLTPSGSNILGLIKHLASVESGYLGGCLGRPFPVPLPWVEDGSIWDGTDMWATPEESRDYIVGLYRDVWAHSDASIAALPFDAPAAVSWWPAERQATTMGHLLVRVIAETAQHAGHIDILRETIDGRGGSDADQLSAEQWADYLATVQNAADAFRV